MNGIVEELRLFWEKGIRRISPGALGQSLRGWPYEASEAKAMADFFPFAHWSDDGWIVLDHEPRAGS